MVGTPISGQFSARRLRPFTPKEGSKLAREETERASQRTAEELVGGASEHERVVPRNESRVENPKDDQEGMEGLPGDEDATTQEGGDMVVNYSNLIT